MKKNDPGITAIGPLLARCFESGYPEEKRLFEDRFAAHFLNWKWRFLMKLLHIPVLGAGMLAVREKKFPGLLGHMICRTRAIDDALIKALSEDFRQVVILGAGFDSRAYRIPGIEKMLVFEVDHPVPQSAKQKMLRKQFSDLPAHVRFAAIDFNQQSLAEALSGAGFSVNEKTFFIGEGLLQYLAAEAVERFWKHVTAVAAPGSQVVFTYIHGGLLDGVRHSTNDRMVMERLQQFGVSWQFGIYPENLSDYLAERHFSLLDELGVPEFQERYLKPLERKINLWDGERVALIQTGKRIDAGGKER